MAYEFSTIKNITLPTGTSYSLKDAQAQLILAGFADAEGSVKAYIDQMADLAFDVIVLTELPHPTAPTEDDYNTYKNKIVLIPDTESKETGAYIENVIVRTGTSGSYTYAWEPIGTTQVDLSEYLTDVSYTNDTHTLSKTKNGTTSSVHQFGALADKSSATGSYTAPTGSGSVTIPKTYTFAGTEDQAVSVTGSVDTYEASTTVISVNYNPATVIESITETTDTVSVTATGGSVTNGSAASFSQGTDTFTQGKDTFTTNTPTAIDTTKFSGGSKASDTFTQGTLPSKAADTFSAGTLPSKAADTFTQGTQASLTTSVEDETLTISFTANTLPTFSEGAFTQGTLPSFTEGAFDAGSLPSFTEGAFTPASLASGFYTPGTAATFTQGTDSFSQGDDSFTANTPTSVTLPTAYETESVVTAISTTSANVAANAFLADDEGSSVGTKEVVTGISKGEATTITSTGTFTATGSVTTATTENATVTVGTTSDTVTVS